MKIEVRVIETIQYLSIIEVELPEGMDEYDFSEILDLDISSKCNSSEEVITAIKTNEKVIVHSDITELDSSSFEITDVERID